MTMSFDTRFLIAKLQTAAGVSAAFDGSDLIPALTLNHRPLEADRNTRDLVDGKTGAGSDFLSRPRVRVDGAVEASAAGAAGSVPFYAPLLLASDWIETVTAGTSVSYAPVANPPSGQRATLVGGFGGAQAAPGNAGDWLQEVIDAVGSLGFEAQEGELPRFTFDLTGVYGAPVARDQIAASTPLDLGAIDNAAYQETRVMSFAETQFSFSGQTLRLRDLNWQDQAQVIYGDRPNELAARRGRRSITGQMVVSAPALGALDYFAQSIAGATHPLSFVHGSGAGNVMEMTAPAVQAFLSELGEDQDEVTATFDLKFLPAAGGDEITVTVR